MYDDAIIVDVLQATRSGYISFNFYEKCAALLPWLRLCLKDHIHEMPREKADYCELKPSKALYKRRWAFTDELGDSHKKEEDAGTHRHPDCSVMGPGWCHGAFSFRLIT